MTRIDLWPVPGLSSDGAHQGDLSFWAQRVEVWAHHVPTPDMSKARSSPLVLHVSMNQYQTLVTGFRNILHLTTVTFPSKKR